MIQEILILYPSMIVKDAQRYSFSAKLLCSIGECLRIVYADIKKGVAQFA